MHSLCECECSSQPWAMCVHVCVYTYVPIYRCMCVQAFVISALSLLKLVRCADWQTFHVSKKVYVSTAAALCGFIFLPTFAAGWRTGGIFCNAAEMVCPWFSARTGLYSWFLIHEDFFPLVFWLWRVEGNGVVLKVKFLLNHWWLGSHEA